MGSDPVKIHNLWRELIPDPTYERENLDDVWAVQLGSTTEKLNLDWYERKYGNPVTKRGEVIISPKHDWAAATLDGWIEKLHAPIETKHVGGFEPLDTIVARYQPQCHWQMIVTGARSVIFSVIVGAKEPTVKTINFDKPYALELWNRAEKFIACVKTLTPPVVLPAVAAPEIAAERDYDMTGNNQWADEAFTWLESEKHRQKAAQAEKNLKALMPADARTAQGYGIKISRDKANRLSLREAKS